MTTTVQGFYSRRRASTTDRRADDAYAVGMKVTLLYFDDCPNWMVADAHLRTLAAEDPGLEIERRIVDTFEAAEETRFRGSPSVLVEGLDLFAEPDAPVGLSCRVYETPAGPAGSPTLEQLRRAISATED